MKVKKFIWIIPYIRLKQITTFPEEFVCLHNELYVDIAELINNQIWLLVNMPKLGRYLYGFLKIESVYGIEQGINKGNYIFTTDRFSSFKILPNSKLLYENWRVETSNELIGITHCDEETYGHLLKLLKQNDKISFNEPPTNLTNKVIVPNKLIPHKSIIPKIYLTTLSIFALGDITRWAKFKELSPFASLAIKKCQTLKVKENFVNAITHLDNKLFNFINGLSDVKTAEIRIDTFMNEINPNSIITRSFVLGSQSHNHEMIVNKTQTAEKKHQAMLKDISRFCISKSIIPYQSRSVDLAFLHNNEISIMEIKSINNENLINQIEKAILQLIKYEMAFEDSGSFIKNKSIIVNYIEEDNIFDFFQRLINKLDIELLFYKIKSPWPKRVPGLIQLIS